MRERNAFIFGIAMLVMGASSQANAQVSDSSSLQNLSSQGQKIQATFPVKLYTSNLFPGDPGSFPTYDPATDRQIFQFSCAAGQVIVNAVGRCFSDGNYPQISPQVSMIESTPISRNTWQVTCQGYAAVSGYVQSAATPLPSPPIITLNCAQAN